MRGPDAPKAKPDRTLNVAFTYAGLTALGVTETGAAHLPAGVSRWNGVEERSRILGDTGESAPSQWELGGPQNPAIHAC